MAPPPDHSENAKYKKTRQRFNETVKFSLSALNTFWFFFYLNKKCKGINFIRPVSRLDKSW